MISKIDDICAKILVVLLKNTADAMDYAQLQRNIGAGSVRTIKKHIEHLLNMGLVNVKTERRGMRFYYRISLSRKGIDIASSFQQKGN